MNTLHTIKAAPDRLPFLEALCWDLPAGIKDLDEDDALNRYERGWRYQGALAEVGADEKAFIKQLADKKGSWLAVHV